MQSGDYTMTDSDGYITEIAGLKADPTSYSLGWMFTFNDWFPMICRQHIRPEKNCVTAMRSA